MHIAVCDDNIADRKQLERLLKRESDKRMNDTGTLYVDSFGDTRVLSKNHMQYDLFFLDMTNTTPDGLTFARQLFQDGVTAPFVLCSSSIDYKAAASLLSDTELPANLMLLDKPIIKAELSSVIDEALVLQSQRVPMIELRSEKETFYVREDDIVYAVPKGRYVHVFLTDGTEIPIMTELRNLYDTISQFAHIVLIEDKAIFNIVYMESFHPFHVMLKNGIRLKSSPLQTKFIKYALHQYQKENKI